MREEYSSIYWVFAIIQVANYEHMYWKRRKRKTLSFFLARKNCEKTTKTTEKRSLWGPKPIFLRCFFGISRFWPRHPFLTWAWAWGRNSDFGQVSDFDKGFLGSTDFGGAPILTAVFWGCTDFGADLLHTPFPLPQFDLRMYFWKSPLAWSTNESL